MKNIKTQLFAVLLGLSAAAVPAAEIAQSTGKVFEGENYTVIRETLPKGKEIPRHNHPGHTLLVTQKPKAARYFCLMAEKGRNCGRAAS